jgi:hypothetical protein
MSQVTHAPASDTRAMVRLAETDICPAYLPEPAWHTVARFTGHGGTFPPRPARTSRFTIRGTGNWVLRYSYDCSGQPGGKGNFIVDEDAMYNDNLSAVAINRLGSGGHGSWHVHGDAGRHYLEILTECPYKITVVQKY